MSKVNEHTEAAQEETQGDRESEVSESRRDAVSKLVYASPVIASIVFSQRGEAQFTPPPPPGG